MGHVKSTKIHGVLCHVLDAVRLHGNIMYADTSSNETGHKDDKRHYARTNQRAGYTRQLLPHAHGTWKVLHRNAVAKVEEDRAAKVHSDYGTDNEAAGTRLRRARTAHLHHERVGELFTRPGLSTLPSVLGMAASHRVAVRAHIFFRARLPSGERGQVVRASPSFHEKQWYDHVKDPSPGSISGEGVRYSQVRLIARIGDDTDRLILAEMKPVRGADECPLSARSWTQLRWSPSTRCQLCEADAQVKLRAISVTTVVRVVHIVPDCTDMGRRESIGVAPPAFDSSSKRLWSMRYLLNAFHPDTEQ